MKYSILSLLAFVLVFSSCSKDGDDIAMPDPTEQDGSDENDGDDKDSHEVKDGYHNDCFELVYPVSYLLPDGTTVSGLEEEVTSSLKAFYEANPNAVDKPALVYPVEIIFEEMDNKVVVTSADEMASIKKEKCDLDGDDDYKEDYTKWNNKDLCFDIVFPISLTMPDGSSISANNEDELEAELKAWYTTHPDSNEKPTLDYPVQITFEDRDAPVTLNSDEELERIIKACKDDYRGGDDEHYDDDCITFVYPLSYTMPDGTTITGDNGEELGELLKAWYSNNQNETIEPSLNFPVQVYFIGEDEALTMSSNENLAELRAKCERLGGDDDDHECFEYVYPISYMMPDGSIITGADGRELRTNLDSWYNDNPNSTVEASLVFPLDIYYQDRDEIYTLTSAEELQRHIDACDDIRADYDCPDLSADVGDKCRKADGTEGMINRECECE